MFRLITQELQQHCAVVEPTLYTDETFLIYVYML